jgi:sterol desaturase/sphingolipid hydroxylase (fatty acid hydroxylase superfamily)
MFDLLLAHHGTLYAFVYFASIGLIALCEAVLPRRQPAPVLRHRWLANFGFAAADTALIAVVFPVLGVGAALLAEASGLGLFNAVPVPEVLAIPICFVMLDAVHYLQHRMLHRVPWLWRLHRMHHTDPDCDFTTGVRFHPLETLFTTAFTLGAILLLGAPPLAVILYQLALAVFVFGVHANVRLPTGLDQRLRRFVVTPDLHRIHHSSWEPETNANLATLFPCWDRWLGTYRDDPALGAQGLRFGLEEFRDRKHLRFGWMLANPFLAAAPDTTRDFRNELRSCEQAKSAEDTALAERAGF